MNERLSATLERHVNAFAWVGHLQNAYYDQHAIPEWTLQDDGSDPPRYPNAWRNPLSALRAGVPREPAVDPLRGPGSPRHKPWNAADAQPTEFDWVPLDQSLQWQAFERIVALLRERHNEVLVMVGPFNEHLIASGQRAIFERMRERIAATLTERGVMVIVPGTLPSEMYADASHPLTQGYAKLAADLFQGRVFQSWIAAR